MIINFVRYLLNFEIGSECIRHKRIKLQTEKKHFIFAAELRKALKKKIHIRIDGNPEASLAEMMQAYLLFYLQANCKIYLRDTHLNITHPLALQVMQEDNILMQHTIITTHDTQHIPEIEILYTQQSQKPDADYHFANPLASSSYEIILENFRVVREEIKKASIAIAGSVLQAH